MIPVVWIAAGAAAMYFLDPEKGGARRAQISGKMDQFRSEHPDLVDVAEGKSAHLRNRAKGMFHGAGSMIQGAIDPPAKSDLDASPTAPSAPISAIDYASKEEAKPDSHRAA